MHRYYPFKKQVEEGLTREERKVEEDHHCIYLYWIENGENGDKSQIWYEFGKRSEFYYKCPVYAMNDTCRCFTMSPRRRFYLKQEKELNSSAEEILRDKGWFNLFIQRIFPQKQNCRGETVVIEENSNHVDFYFSIKRNNVAKATFLMDDADQAIKCSIGRQCSAFPRVTYTTFRNTSSHDKDSKINSLL